MRHGKKFNHLSRTAPHRKAMLSNMAASLILHKRITTTVAKAKALRKYVEPLITRAKDDTTHSRRTVFSYLNDKHSVKMLFDEVAEKIADRPGGYTRILKTGNRLGDNADMCIIELVDYNELLLKEAKPVKAKTRRSRRGKGGQDKENTEEATPAKAAKAAAKEEVEPESSAAKAEEKEANTEKPADKVEAEVTTKTGEEEAVEPDVTSKDNTDTEEDKSDDSEEKKKDADK